MPGADVWSVLGLPVSASGLWPEIHWPFWMISEEWPRALALSLWTPFFRVGGVPFGAAARAAG